MKLKNLEWTGPFEKDATPTAQFQLVTLFAWLGALALLVGSIRFLRIGNYANVRVSLPIGHLLPWVVGWMERRRLLRSCDGANIDGSAEEALQKPILRLLWAVYLVLSIVEYSLY